MSITREDVEKVAAAIAVVQGHEQPTEWAQKVGEAFDTLSAVPTVEPAADSEPPAEG